MLVPGTNDRSWSLCTPSIAAMTVKRDAFTRLCVIAPREKERENLGSTFEYGVPVHMYVREVHLVQGPVRLDLVLKRLRDCQYLNTVGLQYTNNFIIYCYSDFSCMLIHEISGQIRNLILNWRFVQTVI